MEDSDCDDILPVSSRGVRDPDDRQPEGQEGASIDPAADYGFVDRPTPDVKQASPSSLAATASLALTTAVAHNTEIFEAADDDALQQPGGATAEEWQTCQIFNAHSPHSTASGYSELWLQPDIDSLRAAIAHAASVNAPATFVKGEAGIMPDSTGEDARAVQQDKCLRDSSDPSSAAAMHDQTESNNAGWWPYLKVPAAGFALACLIWWLNSDTTTSEAEQAEDDSK